MDANGKYLSEKQACEYITISKQLAEDTAFILRSLGAVVRITKENSLYRLYIKHRNPNKLFRLQRKQHGCFGTPDISKAVVKIEISGEITGQCITVSNPDGLYITNDFIVTHNSWSARAIACLYAMMIPNLQIVILRRTHPELTSTHFSNTPGSFKDILKEEIEAKICTITTAPNKINFANGSIKLGMYCHTQSDLNTFLGVEAQVLIVDEATTFTEDMLKFIKSRVRVALNDEQQKALENFRNKFKIMFSLPLILYCTNPGGVGHSYIKKTIIDPAPPMTTFISEDTELKTIYIPAKLSDNKHLNKEEYEKNLKSLGRPELIKAYLEGDWNIVLGGSAFPNWSPAHNIIKSFKIPSSWHVTRSMDYGYNDKTAILWYAESNGENPDGIFSNVGDIFVIFEYVCKEKTGKELAGIIKKVDSKMPSKVDETNSVADTNIWANVGGVKIYDDFTKNGIKFVPATKGPGSRETGYLKVCEYIENASTKQGKALYIFDYCRNLITDLPILPRSKTNPNDVDTNADDHTYDALRYKLTHKRNYSINTSTLRGLIK